MPEKGYRDFELSIDRSGDAYIARVLNSPAGEAKAQFHLPFSELEIENYVLRLGMRRTSSRRIDNSELAAAKASAAASGMPSSIKRCAAACAPLWRKRAANTLASAYGCGLPTLRNWQIYRGSTFTTRRPTASWPSLTRPRSSGISNFRT
jgi:hypothetical protein